MLELIKSHEVIGKGIHYLVMEYAVHCKGFIMFDSVTIPLPV